MLVFSELRYALWRGGLMAIVGLTWEGPFSGTDFGEDILNMAIILEIPKVADA